MLKSLKDQVRVVRYSIRAEAEAPGSTLPKALQDLRPVLAMGGPALRLADGLFTEVETFATEHLIQAEPALGFPVGLQDLLDRDVGLSGHLYGPYKAMLVESGVRALLVSERALDQAGDRFRDRQADLVPRGRPMTVAEVSRASAALIRTLVEARPVLRTTFGNTHDGKPNVLLSPNLFCAVVTGIATGLVTLKPEFTTEGRTVLESAVSVANVRFARFNRASTSKAPEVDAAKELEVLLPFLP